MKGILFSVLCMGMVFSACNTADISRNSSWAESPEPVLRPAPFTRGVNFSGWFEASGAQRIPFTKYTEQDFEDLKSLGGDLVRLPVKMHNMTGGPPDYTLDPLLVRFLNMAVDWAEKHEIYIIIDNHSFSSAVPTDDNIDEILLPVWAQVAEIFKGRSDFVIYEVLNEPHGISHARWGEIQGAAIETIRRIDQKHAIIVGGADWNSINALSVLPKYDDPNLIYTFHFYDPMIFTHQGASWTSPSLASLGGVPFPYDRRKMPAVPADLKGSWVEGSITHNGYQAASAPQVMAAALDKAVAFSRERGVPIFCGEFGVYMISSPDADRVRWYEFVTGALERRNISRASWDYAGGFGVFNSPSAHNFNTGLNTGVVRAMGFTPPPQQGTQQMEAITSGFTIYDDFPGRQFSSEYWGEGELSMFDASPAQGEFAVRWSDAARYNSFWIGFGSRGDFSYLADAGYCLEFQARTDAPVQFDVRFVNPENASSIPWRVRYYVNETLLPPDGRWHTISVPLKDMEEHGAWVNSRQEWLSPQGNFSWNDVEALHFVAEHGDLKNRTIWLDAIKIVEPK